MSPTASRADLTRQKILGAAFAEFYEHGFQGGSVNHIVEAAHITKGALFHHFAGKQELGYAVIDEIIAPLLEQRWLEPIQNTTDPVADLKRAFRTFVKADMESGAWLMGCPLNNLAQEMSPLDKGFHLRIDHLYTMWRSAFEAAIAAGVKAGTVRKNVSPRDAAALLVASQMGVWGTGKASRNKDTMLHATDAVCAYLDSLQPT